MRKKILSAAAGACIVAAITAGCGDSRDDFVITPPTNVPAGPTLPAVSNTPLFAFVSNNGDSNRGQVDAFDRLFSLIDTGTTGNNEGLDFDSLFNLYHAGDVNAPTDPGSVRIFGRSFDRPSFSFDNTQDRTLGGEGSTLTGLTNPKGFDIAQDAGFMVIADFGAGNLAVFGTAAAGDVAPVATTELSANPWDVAYDQGNDRLYVAMTDGTIQVFDDYIGGGFAPGATATPSRTITPDVDTSNGIMNMHGIIYNASNDALIVSDVGAANSQQAGDFAADGRLYLFLNASTANGNVVPDKTVQGPDTLLGNPVDIDLNGNDLRVAEKAGDQLLIFPDFFNAAGGNFPPTVAVDETKPESVATTPTSFNAPTDASDQDALTTFTGVLATSNQAGTDNTTNGTSADDEIQRVDPSLSTLQANFDIPQDVESAKIDARGDVYVTFDSGVAVLNRVATSRDDGDFDTSRDRVISGNNTTLDFPKGLDIVESRNWIMVADFGDEAVKVFGKEANGDVAPLFTISTGSVDPWDLDYDPVNDRLYVALTDGTIGVYDNVSTDGATATGPDRIITPVDGGNSKISDNLHGIVYDAANDVILVSDVGSATTSMDTGFDTDGSLYVIANGSTADGNVEPTRVIEGPNSDLGNPVDIAFDGTNLYVAEKANDGGQLLRFDDIQGSTGTGDATPDAAFSMDNPESVCINTLTPFTP